jgi:hypothetical protein
MRARQEKRAEKKKEKKKKKKESQIKIFHAPLTSSPQAPLNNTNS